MFIRQLDIEEFRGIKKCEEPLRLSKFNVLIGRNNSGKSTILEAMSMLPLPYGPTIPFMGPSVSPTSKKDFIIQMMGGVSSLVYMYSGMARVSYFIDGNKWEIALDETGRIEISVENVKSPYDRVQIAKLLGVNPSDVDIQKVVFFIPNSTEYIKYLIESLKEDIYWGLVVKQRAHIEVANHISRCIDDKYTEILIYKNALCARKEIPEVGPFYIKLEDLGDGVEKSVAIMLFINALNPDVILWDDFEAAAHPTLIKMLLEWLSQERRQVVLSTHSIDVLDRLLEVRPKDTKVIQLKKTADDILMHRELDLEELETLIGANQDPRLLVDALQL